ncbi:DUF262 domain-containing protein [Lujinxingia vulgaris]|uniref:DUF262 domain-containing protein n=1 Tax=Lujinxingia vulgaris TaxID=2600176 RepID=A0A5C6XCH4_9DELT|nr:DUF262 domain-containing protein [Lujinxingia vulgaris]TXD36981.1 DUF262 domain-containing protein [Lujinxingia vulgaris]
MSAFNPKVEYRIVSRDVSIRDFYDYAEEWVVRPPYQRKAVWSRKKQQSLLDSLFRRYYIPRIVVREVRLSSDRVINEVIDGQQRITTVQNFLSNELPLPKGLSEVDSRLGGATYEELPSDIRRFVDRLTFSSDLVSDINDPGDPNHQNIATEIFWRLQQGESLNYMEVAHSRLSSIARNFVVKYADDQRFDFEQYRPLDENPDKHPFFRIIDRSNERMQHLSLLTRFLILVDGDGDKDLKHSDVLEYIESYNRENGIGDWESMEKEKVAGDVLKTLRTFYDIFKDDPMVADGDGLKELKTEYLIVSFFLLLRHLTAYYVFNQAEKETFRDFVFEFHDRWKNSRREQDTDILVFSEHRQQSISEIKVRDRVMRQLFFEFVASRGHELKTKDERRIFNEAERIQIYRRQNGQCQQCLNEGKPSREAEVSWSEYEADHIIPHSKGGQTATWNGQVLCRVHNRRKSNRVATTEAGEA